MYKERKICVVVPCFNEAKLISKTLVGIPNFVDKIIVVDDFSKDDSTEIVAKLKKKDNRIFLIQHNQNRGVGAAIKSGYQLSIDENFDISVVMAGDNQMDSTELPRLIDPIINDNYDYSKGNRLKSPNLIKMPLLRRFGNSLLTLLNRISSGYWDIYDPQNGYTAISNKSLKRINLDNIYGRYGYCNDMLIEANINGLKVCDVSMDPVYADEKSGIRLIPYTLRISLLLLFGFFRRINQKYGGLNFHPIWLFFFISFSFLFGTIILTTRMLLKFKEYGEIPPINALALGVCVVAFSQFFLFALWMDSQNSN